MRKDVGFLKKVAPVIRPQILNGKKTELEMTNCTFNKKSSEQQENCFWTAGVFSLNPIVNKLCKIGCCGNKMYGKVENMIQIWGLELEESSKCRVSSIFGTLRCILLLQHSILYDLYTIGLNGKTLNVH